MECGNCGRHNQPTTRFCAECGDVLRADPPRKRRSASAKRRRKARVRVHWVRIPPRPGPSVLSARLPPSAAASEASRAPERMMRTIDLALAAIVGVVGLLGYVAYPYLKQAPSAESARAPAPAPVEMVQAPLPLPEPRAPEPVPPAVETAPSPAAVAAAPASRSRDIVPPREPSPRSDPPSRRQERPPPPPSYAMPTAFGSDAHVPPPVAAPTRVAAAPAAAPARKDRLQQMNEAIAGCSNEGLFGRIACEQRALLAYCEGQWGRNERCPSGRTADYGN